MALPDLVFDFKQKCVQFFVICEAMSVGCGAIALPRPRHTVLGTCVRCGWLGQGSQVKVSANTERLDRIAAVARQ